MTLSQDEIFMREALAEAKVAFALGEVPVGAVVVREGQIIARGHNRREIDRLATAHAELLAMEAACRAIGSWRLSDCTLYVTLEPCPMCAGAILAARVGRVVYAAKDPVAGAMGSVLNLPRFPLGAHPQVESGVLLEEARELLQAFFRERREKEVKEG